MRVVKRRFSEIVVQLRADNRLLRNEVRLLKSKLCVLEERLYCKNRASIKYSGLPYYRGLQNVHRRSIDEL